MFAKNNYFKSKPNKKVLKCKCGCCQAEVRPPSCPQIKLLRFVVALLPKVPQVPKPASPSIHGGERLLPPIIGRALTFH
jgi:hypothetical protein